MIPRRSLLTITLLVLALHALLLGGALPGLLGWAGIALTVVGLVLYLLAQQEPS